MLDVCKGVAVYCDGFAGGIEQQVGLGCKHLLLVNVHPARHQDHDRISVARAYLRHFCFCCVTSHHGFAHLFVMTSQY